MTDIGAFLHSNPSAPETHLQRLLRAYREIEVKYTLRTCPETKYTYVFLGDRSDIFEPNGTFDDGDLEVLTRREKFMEFSPDGSLASY
ncbi:hypothetical protein VCHA53O466_50450 [Vibrio chagasii]|nr:hypothetical protein VCHA53O466_50450 [Vibrio chagasii]